MGLTGICAASATHDGSAPRPTHPRQYSGQKPDDTLAGKRGAAMVVVRAWPAPEDPEVELHMFKCEVCEAVDFFRFKARPQNNHGTA